MSNKRGRRFTRRYLKVGKRIIEIGSMDINGSVTEIVKNKNPKRYLRIDLRKGPNVDKIYDIRKVVPIKWKKYWGTVICLETLEHIKEWGTAIKHMKQLLKDGGEIIMTTRSRKFKRHEYPCDYFRFNKDEIEMIFSDFKIIKMEKDNPKEPGIFIYAKKK